MDKTERICGICGEAIKNTTFLTVQLNPELLTLDKLSQHVAPRVIPENLERLRKKVYVHHACLTENDND
jgi:Ni,Fe-hydrogenase III large subunit